MLVEATLDPEIVWSKTYHKNTAFIDSAKKLSCTERSDDHLAVASFRVRAKPGSGDLPSTRKSL